MFLKREASDVLILSFSMFLSLLYSDYNLTLMYISTVVGLLALIDLLLNQLYRSSFGIKLIIVIFISIGFGIITIISFIDRMPMDTIAYYIISFSVMGILIIYNWLSLFKFKIIED